LVKGSGQGGGFVSCSPKYIIKKRLYTTIHIFLHSTLSWVSWRGPAGTVQLCQAQSSSSCLYHRCYLMKRKLGKDSKKFNFCRSIELRYRSLEHRGVGWPTPYLEIHVGIYIPFSRISCFIMFFVYPSSYKESKEYEHFQLHSLIMVYLVWIVCLFICTSWSVQGNLLTVQYNSLSSYVSTCKMVVHC
jgi:hypothetical protein